MLSVSLSSSAQGTSDYDMTSLVKTDQASWHAAGMAGTWAAPVVITTDGRSAQMAEVYAGDNANATGVMLYQDVAGLKNGNYTVTLCANAFYTDGRGIATDNPISEAGADDIAFVYANSAKAWLHATNAEKTAKNGEFALDVTVTDGTLKLGLEKAKAGTNWHSIQIKSLIWHATAEEYADYIKPFVDANAALVEGATPTNPKEAPFLQNGTFDDGTISPWVSNTGAYSNQTATNQGAPFNPPYYENWNGDPLLVGKMYQVINYVPNGVYKLQIGAFVQVLENPNDCQYVYANDNKTFLTSVDPTMYEVMTVVKNNKIEVGLEQTKGVTQWCGIDNVKLFYCGTVQDQATLTYEKASAIVSGGKPCYTGTIAELKEAMDALNQAMQAGDVDAMSDNIPKVEAEIAKAEACIASYEKVKAALDKSDAIVEKYDAAGKKAYDDAVASLKADYAAGAFTNDEYLQKIEDINNVLKAAAQACVKPQTGADMTPLIDNPSFEDDLWKWDNTGGMCIQTNNEFKKDGAKYAEFWQPDGIKKLSQQISSLPQGVYQLTAVAKARGMQSASLNFAGKSVAIEISDEAKDYTVMVMVDGKSPVEVSVEGEGTGAEHSWFAVDNFRLSYIEQPVVPVELTIPSGNDIGVALEQAKASLEEEGIPAIAGDIMITLEKDGKYTITKSLETSANFLLEGENATIDASGLGNNAFVLMGANPVVEEGQNGQIVDAVNIKNVNINDLPSYLYNDNGKKWIINDFALENCVVKLNTTDEAVKNNALINAYGYGIVSCLIADNTIYNVGEAASAPKYLIRYNNAARAGRMGAEAAYVIVRNNTISNILNSNGQFANYSGLSGQSTSVFTMTDNIFVGMSDVARRFIGGNYSSNPTYTFANNTYMLTDGTFNDQSNYDKSGTAIECNPGFADAANGNFTLSSRAEQAYYKTGDPRWLTEYDGPVIVKSLAELNAIKVEAEGPGVEVKVKLTDAKITAIAENMMGFMEDATAGTMIAIEDEIAGVAAGKSLTGSLTGGYMNYGTGPVFILTEFAGKSADVDVTKGAEIVEATELAQPFNQNRLVTIVNTKALPIINDGEGNVTVGGFVVTNEVLCDPFEYPANIESITGIVMSGSMFGEEPVIVVRGPQDVVAGEPTPLFIVESDAMATIEPDAEDYPQHYAFKGTKMKVEVYDNNTAYVRGWNGTEGHDLKLDLQVMGGGYDDDLLSAKGGTDPSVDGETAATEFPLLYYVTKVTPLVNGENAGTEVCLYDMWGDGSNDFVKVASGVADKPYAYFMLSNPAYWAYSGQLKVDNEQQGYVLLEIAMGGETMETLDEDIRRFYVAWDRRPFVDPIEGKYKTIDKITITFSEPVKPYVDETAFVESPTFANDKESFGGVLAQGANENELVWTPYDVINKDGLYKFTIPAGCIELADGSLNTESWVYDYTISGNGGGEVVPTYFGDVTANPASGSKVKDLAATTLTYATPWGQVDVQEGKMIQLLDAEGKAVADVWPYLEAIYNETWQISGGTIKIEETVAPGEYTLVVPLFASNDWGVTKVDTVLNLKYTVADAAPIIVAPTDAKYFWASNADAVVTEVGGTIVASAAAPERLNYAQAGYNTICLNGKKDLSDDKYMTVTLDKPLAEGDVINITAFKNKDDESKKSAALFTFSNGATYNTGDVFNNIYEGHTTGDGKPNKISYTVTAAEAGATSFTITRGETATNLFITELYISDQAITGINGVETDGASNDVIFNIRGQKVDKNFRGIVIKNGKKLLKK